VKILAVSQRVDQITEHDEIRDALDRRLIAFLIAAGFIPVPIPNGLCNALPYGRKEGHLLDIWLDAAKPQALVLSGGNDIGQDLDRDSTEDWLLGYAERRRLPTLGICRGMQMMARYSGASLKLVDGHICTRHRLSGEITGEANSYHRYSISSCPTSFEVFARSEDGEIEAIRHESLPWEGWMWHPEREASFDLRDLNRLRQLVK